MPKNEVVVKEELEDFKIDLKPKIPQFPDVDLTQVNLKYPLIAPYAFAHLFWDFNNKELVYFVEEPGLNLEEIRVLDLLEDGIKQLVNISFLAVKDGDTVIKYLEKNIRVLLRELKIEISNNSYQKIMYFIYRDFVGLGKIEPFLCDYFIEDIECNGVNFPIYIIHRKYRNLRTNIIYDNADRLATFVERLAQKCGHYISYATPLLDGSLPDGSRVNATFTEDITSRGPSFCFTEGYLQLGDGSIKKIDRLFNDAKYKFPTKLENGNEIVQIHNITCCGVDEKTLIQQNSRLRTIIKLIPPKELVKVELEDGSSITTTTNHLFHVADEKLELIEAKDLKRGMLVPIPKKIEIVGCTQKIDTYSIIKEFSYAYKVCLISSPIIKEIVTSEITNYQNQAENFRVKMAEDYGTHGSYFYEITNRGNSISFEILDSLCKNTTKNFEDLGELSLVVYGGGVKGKSKSIKVPKEVDEDLAYLTGMIISDGHLSKDYLDISCFEEGCKESAKNKLISKFGKCNEYYNGSRLYLCNIFAPYFFNKVFDIPYGNKSNKVVIPSIISKSDNKVIASFIKGLFDGDGTCKSGLSYKTHSRDLAEGLTYLLARLGIYSYLRKNKITSEKYEYKLNIPSPYYNVYLNIIGFDNKEKLNSLSKLVSLQQDHKTFTRHDRIPAKPVIRIIQKLNLSKNKLSKKVNVDYNRFYYDTFSRSLVRKLIEEFKNYELKDCEEELEYVQWLIETQQEFVKVSKAELIQNTDNIPVYDIELEPCKFFIAGNKPMNVFDTIRKFTQKPWPPTKLVQLSTLNPQMLAYLWLLVEYETNIMVIGGTASGKTTLLNALAYFIPPQARVVSIEDTRELNLQHSNWLPSVAREGVGLTNLVGQKYGDVTLFDLLKESFRQNPDYVIVGEVRGKEAYVLFQGMSSGHPSFGTMHANSVDTMLRRLETPPINLSPSLVEILDIVIVMTQTKIKGTQVRRVREINEIISVKEGSNAQIHTPFKWDPINDKFTFSKQSYVFSKINLHQGISQTELLKEMEVRTKLITVLFNKGIFDFLEFRNIVNEYYKDPKAVLKRYNII